MNLFYSREIKGSTVRFAAEESHHCTKVLRHRKGDQILITDGKGTIREAVILSDDPRSCIAEIAGRNIVHPPLPCDIHIAIAPTKNMNRFEWFLEKSTELGIGTITPLLCQRSERSTVKVDRLQKVILSAMKQSFSAFLPSLSEPISLPFFLEKTDGTAAVKFMGHCHTSDRQYVKDVYSSGSDVVFLIGPEGDFTSEEVQMALNHGFIPVILGRNRLRTETAGLIACHTIHMLNESSGSTESVPKAR
jgi:16S rRNA (uracil1498-N3)-methyltransferase